MCQLPFGAAQQSDPNFRKTFFLSHSNPRPFGWMWMARCCETFSKSVVSLFGAENKNEINFRDIKGKSSVTSRCFAFSCLTCPAACVFWMVWRQFAPVETLHVQMKKKNARREDWDDASQSNKHPSVCWEGLQYVKRNWTGTTYELVTPKRNASSLQKAVIFVQPEQSWQLYLSQTYCYIAIV